METWKAETAAEPGPLIMLCPRERAPIQTDERERPWRRRGVNGCHWPCSPSASGNLPRYPSLSLIIVLQCWSEGPGSRGSVTALLLEGRGKCNSPVMTNTEIAGQEAQQPPPLPCLVPGPDSNYSATCQLKNNRSRIPQLTSWYGVICVWLFSK